MSLPQRLNLGCSRRERKVLQSFFPLRLSTEKLPVHPDFKNMVGDTSPKLDGIFLRD
jgi:hypothetical protein